MMGRDGRAARPRRVGASEPTGAIVGRLTATERGEYPAFVLVDGPLGEREYRPAQAPASCTNIDAEFGARKSGRRGFTCSACWEQCDAVPRFCPGCGAEVKR